MLEIVQNRLNMFIMRFWKVFYFHNQKDKIKFFNQCKNIIDSSSLRKAVVIGRIAGQYAKPRTS
jgi:3-deoxy-D-arabino-heptulosonate 7-phosphate (DAHP) synthase class II